MITERVIIRVTGFYCKLIVKVIEVTRITLILKKFFFIIEYIIDI